MGDVVGINGKAPMGLRDARPSGPPPTTPSGAPPFWYWMLLQRAADNSDGEAEAAVYIADRWPVGPDYNHARVLRTLRRESSVHYDGACRLADSYCEFADVDVPTAVAVRNSVHPLRPIGREQCEHVYSDGRTCPHAAVPFTGRCTRHGGQWVDPEDFAAISRTIRDRVQDMSLQALGVVESLMQEARSEKVRLEAANLVLRMAGADPAAAGAVVRIDTGGGSVEIGPDPADLVRQRLESLASHSTIVGEVVNE